ncbi:MAG: [citrate (pro-3S)-lyase] ligase [Limosilactobacillus gorillae]|jgi:[citrate (pro-3S)-lyase] ligase|uniref:[citrate (pro-3S)-lyase] ligase n=1 Tax=Limosilactobacillus gorillae TaxID=1450649 RepID=UPI000AAEFA33|nr:[citrate (pro-3S)-lyase] ligase [Limosilactobacillus gorillae]MDO4855186.1 [citrate (pro-3S)-lyase] ligase [Limosilactobacillus gorillae]
MEVKEVDVKNRRYRHLWQQFLESNGITGFSAADLEAIDTTSLWLDEEGEVIATGSLAGHVLKYLAIDENHRQAGTTFNIVVSHLTELAAQRGHYHLFVFTKPEYEASFQHVGFQLLAHTPQASLLETGMPTIKDYLNQIKHSSTETGTISAIVMNANPFTKGHRYLVEQASRNSALVYLFVVSNDVSLFKTTERKELVEAGVKDLSNVVVVDGGDYQISPATFPAYFLKSDQEIGDYQAHLDAQLFKQQIAPALGITDRYVGSEPHSKTTENYNQALAEVLPPTVTLHVIPRCQSNNGDVISATRIRQAIKEGRLEDVKCDLPTSTFAFLKANLPILQARLTTHQQKGF